MTSLLPAGGANKRTYLYLVGVVLLFTVLPLLHRLVDWKVGYSERSFLSVLPLVAMIPAAIYVLYSGRLARMPKALLICLWLWVGGFVFSFAVGIAAGNAVASFYTMIEFVLPALFAAWLATTDLPCETLYQLFSRFLLWLSVPMCLYAVLQFVAVPPWDAEWMHDAHMSFIGVPLPYSLRPFSATNGPPQFGDFLLVVIVLNLPRLRNVTPILLGQLALCILTLVLTMVRADWVTLAVAVMCYIVMSPQRARNLTVVALVAGLGAVLVFNASSLLGSSAAGNALSTRFSTFSNLDNDVSVTERTAYFGDTLNDALSQPAGQGLGVTGSAARLSRNASDNPYDDGYIARFVEMGFFGFACYVGTLIVGIILAFTRWRTFSREGATEDAAIMAALVAMQLALIVLDASIDHHTNFPGLLFWLTLVWAYRWREVPANKVPSQQLARGSFRTTAIGG